jgi:hypothetical protein
MRNVECGMRNQSKTVGDGFPDYNDMAFQRMKRREARRSERIGKDSTHNLKEIKL